LADTTRGMDAGSAYVFVRSGSSWSQEAKLEASDGAFDDRFGYSVSLSGDGSRALIGAFADDTTRGSNAGSAYVFGLVKTNGDPCSMGSECMSGHCVDGVCCDSSCGGGSTSDCQACSRSAGASADGTCGPLVAAVARSVICRSAVSVCDVAETCVEGSTSCPADRLAPAGTACRPAAGPCDVAETCSGTSAECPDDAFASAGTVCRAGGDACDPAETCDGTSPTCPEDVTLPDGMSCSDGAVCNGEERCRSGLCVLGTPLDCDDGDACTADSCAEPDGCQHEPIAGCCRFDSECDDGDACTTDACASNRCRHEPIADCGGSDAGMMDGADAGTGTDGGTTAPDGGSGMAGTGGGCGCRTGRPASGNAALAFAALALVVLARRRRSG
jgi:MYXO-CTERM domain-containing protein